jgi:hypothetical protein
MPSKKTKYLRYLLARKKATNNHARAIRIGFTNGLTAYTNLFVHKRTNPDHYVVSTSDVWTAVGKVLDQSMEVELGRVKIPDAKAGGEATGATSIRAHA